jgi:hypothetical protein
LTALRKEGVVIYPGLSSYDAMRATLSSGWAVGAVFFERVGPGVERLETGLLAGHDGRSDGSLDGTAVVLICVHSLHSYLRMVITITTLP